MCDPSLPSASFLREQAAWLAPARSRLLRRANIARCGRVLDLGCGSGAVTGELVRRAIGPVVALDRNHDALAQLVHNLHSEPKRPGSPLVVAADASRLPLAGGSFDLVFCQFTLMWVDLPATIGQIHRVLVPGGRLIALEPDYAGLIEHPGEIATRELWLAGLSRAGADPSLGRRLPKLLTQAGFSVRVDLLDQLVEPSPMRFEVLSELPLEPSERAILASARSADTRLTASKTPRVAHLPVFLVTAERS